jgi:hypothetical protein
MTNEPITNDNQLSGIWYSIFGIWHQESGIYNPVSIIQYLGLNLKNYHHHHK